MKELIKVENDTLARDLTTSALLETDVVKLRKYRSMKRSVKQKDEKIDTLSDRINKLEQLIGRMLNDGNNNF